MKKDAESDAFADGVLALGMPAPGHSKASSCREITMWLALRARLASSISSSFDDKMISCIREENTHCTVL